MEYSIYGLRIAEQGKQGFTAYQKNPHFKYVVTYLGGIDVGGP